MITPELLARINELSRKKRTEGLSQEELAEQAALRRVYLDSIKSQVMDLLDNIEIVDTPAPSEKVLHQTHITLGNRVLH